MTKIAVNLGAKKKVAPIKMPRERKSVHPGLLQFAESIRCQKCSSFLSWVPASGLTGLQVSACHCGFWVKDFKGYIRWIRFSW